MNLARLLLPIIVTVSPAFAQDQALDVPQLFAVAGVAADDVLNVRAGPTAASDVVGTLAPAFAGLEVTALSENGKWGRVGAGETDGWVSMAYLAPLPFPAGDVPDGMQCLGTEPFWLLSFEDGTATYASPDENWPAAPFVGAATGIPPGTQLFGFDAAFESARLTGTISARQCSDGMSDRSFGWSVDLMRQAEGTMALLHGCCTLDRR